MLIAKTDSLLRNFISSTLLPVVFVADARPLICVVLTGAASH
jgi:hypothetical protein